MRIGESQQTRRSGKRASAAREPTPATPPPEGGGEEGASPHATDKCPEALPPLSPDQSRAGGEEAPHKTLGAPRDPPLFPCSPKGREEKKKKTQEAKLPKKFPRKGKSKAQKEQSLKGEKMSYTKRTLPQFPLSQKTQSTRHNMALAQYNPYT